MWHGLISKLTGVCNWQKRMLWTKSTVQPYCYCSLRSRLATAEQQKQALWLVLLAETLCCMHDSCSSNFWGGEWPPVSGELPR
jgi:hypothetical protein